MPNKKNNCHMSCSHTYKPYTGISAEGSSPCLLKKETRQNSSLNKGGQHLTDKAQT